MVNKITIRGGVLENLIDFMTLCYIVITGVSSDIISSGLSNLWCAVIIVLCLCHKMMKNKWNITQYTFVVFLFAAYSLVSLLWSQDFETSKERVTTVLLLFVFSSLLYDYLLEEKKQIRYLHMVCWGGILYSLYIFLSYGLGNYIQLLLGGNRVGSDVTSFNNNGVGRITAIVAILCLAVFFNGRKKPYLIGFFVCTLAMLGAGSRTAIGGYAVGLITIFMFRKTRRRFVNLFSGALVVIVALFVIQLPAFEFIASRIDSLLFGLAGEGGEADYSTLERMELNEVAIEQFKNTPIFGIGIGASGVLTKRVMGIASYMHNNYLELLCCGGIVGTVIYYLQLLLPARGVLKNYKNRSNEQTLALILVVMYLIMHFGTVSYFDKSVYIHMVLIHLLASCQKKETET